MAQENDDNATAPEAGGDDLEALFAEAASAVNPPAVEGGDQGEAAGETEAEGAIDTGAEQGAGQDQLDAPSAPADQQATDDIWSAAPEALKTEFQKIQDERERNERLIKQLKGQLSATDRQLDQLRRASAGRTSQDEQSPVDLKALLGSDKMKQFRDEYGEIADVLIPILETQADTIERLTGTVSQGEQRAAAQAYDHELASYEREHPDWRDYASHGGFSDWIATQPRHVREAAARNAEYITDASEASDILSRFKVHLAGSQPAPAITEETKPEPAPQPQDHRRDKQLEGARTVKTSQPAVTTGHHDDIDSAFKSAAAVVDAQMVKNRRF